MTEDKYFSIAECSIGDDSKSGNAVQVTIDGHDYWVPYSQIKELHRDPRSKGADCIVVTKWLARREGWL